MKTPTWIIILVLLNLSLPTYLGAQAQNQYSRAVKQMDNATDLSLLESRFRSLARLVDIRLSYMKDVAAYKWVNKLPIEDLEREQVVLKASMESARSYGLDPQSTQVFFQEQISLAKSIQQFWFDKWTQSGFDYTTYGDLNTFVRPALIDLGDAILKSISRLKPWQLSATRKAKGEKLFIKELKTIGVSTEDKVNLYQAVPKIKSLDNPSSSIPPKTTYIIP